MRVRTVTSAVAFFLSVFLFVPTGWAQLSRSDQEAAKAHFLAGSSYYESANYADAVKEFNEAYRLSKRPDLLYNIALCYERLSDYDNAISTLKRYLIEKPTAPDRNIIESRVQNLERLREIRNAPPAPLPTIPSPPKPIEAPPPAQAKPSLHTLGYAGIGSGALGVVFLSSSIGTGTVAKQKSDQLVLACPSRVNCNPSLQSVQQQGRRLAVATDAMIGLGMVAIAAGVALLVVDLVVKPKPAAKPADPKPADGGPPAPPQPAPTAPPVSVSFAGQDLLLRF